MSSVAELDRQEWQTPSQSKPLLELMVKKKQTQQMQDNIAQYQKRVNYKDAFADFVEELAIWVPQSACVAFT